MVDSENSVRGEGVGHDNLTTFLVINVVHRGPYEPASRAAGHKCFPSVSALVFLMKPIATCDFPGQEEGRDPLSPPL